MDANAWQLDWKSSLSAPRFQDSQNAGVTYKSKENLLQEIVIVPLKDMIWVWVQACRCSTHSQASASTCTPAGFAVRKGWAWLQLCLVLASDRSVPHLTFLTAEVGMDFCKC